VETVAAIAVNTAAVVVIAADVVGIGEAAVVTAADAVAIAADVAVTADRARSLVVNVAVTAARGRPAAPLPLNTPTPRRIRAAPAASTDAGQDFGKKPSGPAMARFFFAAWKPRSR
jgi:hypothetical protein